MTQIDVHQSSSLAFDPMSRFNNHGQPIGADLGGWTPPSLPVHQGLEGRTVRLEPLQRTQHAIPLFHTFSTVHESQWTYMPLGPFDDAAELGQLFDAMNKAPDVQPYAVIVGGEVRGFLCYLRMQPDIGVIEIGWVMLSPSIQRTTASTEAINLALTHAFGSGYRRVEWKCDALNEKSRTSAERLGFMFEGVFRNGTHYKGRNRDTAWYAMTDDDWFVNARVHGRWLSMDNFDAHGVQRKRLGELS